MMQGHALAANRLALPPKRIEKVRCPSLAKLSLNPTRIASPPRHRQQLRIVSFGILKSLGLKKPAWLPDFGRDKRKALMARFFGPPDRATYEELLAPNFVIREDKESRTYNRQEWIDFMCNRVDPAIPDFTWTPATDGAVADDGYAVVQVEAAGHHNGTALDLGGNLPVIPASGIRFRLPPTIKKVKVENGQIQEIIALGGEGKDTGPMALYKALGGEVPATEDRKLGRV